MHVNLASASKLERTQQIITDIGLNGFMQLYPNPMPASPDLPTSAPLLASLRLPSAVAGTASLALKQAVITAPGTTGVDGWYMLTITSGGGTGAAGFFLVANNILSFVGISDYGWGYVSTPTISGFGTAGLSGAIAIPVMTSLLSFTPMDTLAIASGTVGWARITQADGVTGVLDLDVGMTNAAMVVMTNIKIISGSPIEIQPFIIEV
jgi:hypothetical protein